MKNELKNIYIEAFCKDLEFNMSATKFIVTNKLYDVFEV